MEEIVDFLGAKVPRQVPKLIDCDFNVDLLSDLDATLGFLEHCLVLGLLVKQVEQELVNIVLLVLVLG